MDSGAYYPLICYWRGRIATDQGGVSYVGGYMQYFAINTSLSFGDLMETLFQTTGFNRSLGDLRLMFRCLAYGTHVAVPLSNDHAMRFMWSCAAQQGTMLEIYVEPGIPKSSFASSSDTELYSRNVMDDSYVGLQCDPGPSHQSLDLQKHNKTALTMNTAQKSKNRATNLGKEKMKKKKKNSQDEEEKEDRLSSLPDAILIIILSLLPTKSAVITGALSRRWRGLWTSVTSLDMIPSSSKFDYSTIVNKLLKQLTSPTIRRVRLVCGECINKWVSHVCTRNVEEIQLATLDRPKNVDLSVLSSPILFRTKSLVTLELGPRLFCNLRDDVTIKLPNLKKLVVTAPNRKFIEKLIRYCTSLEELFYEEEVNSWGALNGTTINISSQNLRLLTLRLWSFGRIASVGVSAPKLQHFVFHSHWIKCCFVNEKPVALREAEIKMLDCPKSSGRSRVLDLFKTISGVTSLRLDDYALPALLGLVDEGELKLFPNLTCLTLLPQCQANCRNLLKLLELSPFLEVLILNMACLINREQISWNPCECSAPACFLTHVRSIEIKILIPVKDKYLVELMQFMLCHAKVLEHFSVKVHHRLKFKHEDPGGQLEYNSEIEFCKQLFHWPRSSSHCHVELLGTHLAASNKATKPGSNTYNGCIFSFLDSQLQTISLWTDRKVY